MAMIPAKDFKQELSDKLEAVYLAHPNHQKYVGTDNEDYNAEICKFLGEMNAGYYILDLQFPEIRQYLRYILARSDIDWSYNDTNS